MVKRYQKQVKRRVPYGARLALYPSSSDGETFIVTPPGGYMLGGGTLGDYVQGEYNMSLSVSHRRLALRLVRK